MLHRYLAALVLALAACGGSSSTNADATTHPDADPPDSGGSACCTLQLQPTTPCGCIKIGGPTPPNGMCPERCGVSPSDFNVMPGDNGCLINVIPQNSVCEPPDGG